MGDPRPVRWLSSSDEELVELARRFELPLECPPEVLAAAARVRGALGLEPWILFYGVNVAGSLPTARIEVFDTREEPAELYGFEGHSVAELLEALLAAEAGVLEALDSQIRAELELDA